MTVRGFLLALCLFGLLAGAAPARAAELVPAAAAGLTSDGRLGAAGSYFVDDWHQYYINSDNGSFYSQYSSFPWDEIPTVAKRTISQPNGPDILVLDFTNFSLAAGVKVWILGSRPVLILSQTDITIAGMINPRVSGADINDERCYYCGDMTYSNGGQSARHTDGTSESGNPGMAPMGSLVSSGGGGGAGAGYVYNSTTPWGWDLVTGGGGGGGGGAVAGANGVDGVPLYGTGGVSLAGGLGGAARSANVFQGGGGGGQGGYAHTWYCCWTGASGAKGGGAIMFMTPGNLTVAATGQIHADGDRGSIGPGDAGAGGGGGGGELRFAIGGGWSNQGAVTARGGNGGPSEKPDFAGSHGGHGGGGRIVIRALEVTGAELTDVGDGEVIVENDGGSIDEVAPIVTVPTDLTIEAASVSGASATFEASAIDDVDGVLAATCNPASGSTFAIGTTTVTCTAIDAAGNEGGASFHVTVADTTPPAISNVPGSQVVDATSLAGAIVTYASPTATDIVSGVVTPSCLPASGSTFPAATTTVTCSASDGAGNTATASFTVRVRSTAEQRLSALLVTLTGMGTGKSLGAKVQTALAALAVGDMATAAQSLQALINEANAQTGKSLTTAEAASIITAAQQIRSMLGF